MEEHGRPVAAAPPRPALVRPATGERLSEAARGFGNGVAVAGVTDPGRGQAMPGPPVPAEGLTSWRNTGDPWRQRHPVRPQCSQLQNLAHSFPSLQHSRIERLLELHQRQNRSADGLEITRNGYIHFPVNGDSLSKPTSEVSWELLLASPRGPACRLHLYKKRRD